MENEIWKDIPGYEGYYQVSNYGRTKSVDRYVNHFSGILVKRKGKILKPIQHSNGYITVNLKQKSYLQHRLVWEAFVGPIPEGMHVNHINEDKLDNRLENLNLMTPTENHNWGTGIERQRTKMINGKNSKPVLQKDLNGRLIKEWPSMCEVKRVLGFDYQNISTCCKNDNRTAYGYKWSYKNQT